MNTNNPNAHVSTDATQLVLEQPPVKNRLRNIREVMRPQFRQINMIKTTFTVVLTVALALLAYGRPMRAWSYQEMNDQADLVVIAKPISATNTTETSVLPNTSPGVRVVGVETEFEVRLVMKGNRSLKTLVLHHYRLANPEEHLFDGPALFSFDPKQSNRFLLFLHRDSDGRYSPVSGQTDPAMISVLKLEGLAH